MSTTSVPPRFVPTLTDVVPAPQRDYAAQFENTPYSHAHASGNAYMPPNSFVGAPPLGLNEDLLVKRVMQQVDVVLQRRLREALGRVILEQTEALAPKLRSEIEQVVKESIAQAIAQAIAQEMPGRQG